MQNSIKLTQIGRYESGVFDDGAAEITAYDPDSQSLYVINGSTATIDILDISDPTEPTFSRAIATSELGSSINSVAIKNGIVAAALAGESVPDPGSVVFFDSEDNVLNQVTVGAFPDAIAFGPDGTQLVVANEGEAA
ncbi:MAG: alkaline phosphatase, partial [Cyanobacteria bacterium J06555_3]